MILGAYVARRLGLTLFILWGVLTFLFFLFQMAGGDPALAHAGKNTDVQSVTLLRQTLGLDQPLIVQYGSFLKDAVAWNWGTSWASQRPVLGLVAESLGPSLSITLVGFVVTFWLALIVASLAVHYRGRVGEKLITFLVTILMSTSFVVIILAMQKVFAYELDWFPIFGWDSGVDRWRYVALPIFIYVVGTFSPKFLVFRSLVREEMDKRYVLTAQSKGVSWWSIYTNHVFKNIWPALITLVSAQIPAVLTGSLLLEIYFGIPGVGHLLLKAIQGSDYPVVKALTILGAMVYIIAVFVGDVMAQLYMPRGERK